MRLAYLCEFAFSMMNVIKPAYCSRFIDDHLGSSVRLVVRNYIPIQDLLTVCELNLLLTLLRVSEYYKVALFSYTRAFGEGLRNFEHIQVMRMTPVLASPHLLTTTPNQLEDIRALTYLKCIAPSV
ncbi:hypothetical protein TNCV_2241511 [Trichonephila clavipes]|nr:hypothetical protein TNCV_2241511 [Trichonephila clavipes]